MTGPRLPTSEVAKRLTVMVHRKLTTPWMPKEIKQFRFLLKQGYFDDLSNLELVERYQAAQRKLGLNGFHRRQLYQVLNNWTGEVDKATDWAERNKDKKLRDRPNAPIDAPEPSDEDRAKTREGLKQLRRNLGNGAYMSTLE